MSDEVMDVSAESSTATETQTEPTGQAPSAPVNGNGQGQPRMIPLDSHIRERQSWQQREREYQRQLQEFQQRQQQAPPTDEEKALKDARDALFSKVAPELKDVAQQLQEMRQGAFFQQGDAMIGRFAQAHGLDTDELMNAFAEVVKSDPALMQRVQQGDVRLVAQYLKGIEPVVKTMKTQGADAQRQATAGLAATKNNLVRNVRQSGSQSGPSAPKPLTGDFRKDMTAMNAEADVMLRSLQKG